jgi:CBS domain-containing protein
MLKARDIMTAPVISVSPDTEMAEVAKLLLERHINGLPVVDSDERLVGIICQSDLITQQKKLPIPSFFTLLDGLIPFSSVKKLENEVRKIAAVTVEQSMTSDPLYVSPDTPIQEIANLMVDMHYHTLPVVEEGKLVGVIGKEDILRTLI